MMKLKQIGYELLRTYVHFAFWLSHRKIAITGRKNIPKGKPIIFAPNHQNALMDPLALVCTNRHQTYWLARADIFKSRIFRPILKFMKIWPVYRIRDGKENLSNNEEIFDKVTQLLEDMQSVALFPEAAHSGRRQMLPHKKAIPRIALEAEAKNNFGLNLQIVPVGITYSHYWEFGRSLLVQYGEPISIDSFWVDYEVNPQKTMLDLRDQIYEKLYPLVIEIRTEKYYQEYESIRSLAGKAYSRKKFFSKNKASQRFLAEKELISKLEKLENEFDEDFLTVITELRRYEHELKEAKIKDKLIENVHNASKLKTSISIVFALISLPVFIAGLLFNAIPFYLPRAWVSRKVKDKIFTSSFNYVLGIIIFPVFYLIVYFLLLQPRFSIQVSLLVLVLMPFLGKIGYTLLQFYRNVAQQAIYLFGKKTNKVRMDQLIEKRWILVELILEKVNF